jgi:hypothetical protein
MELEGAKKGIEFKNQKQPSLLSNNHFFSNQIPKTVSTIRQTTDKSQVPVTMETSLLEASMLISFYDRSKIIKDNQLGINQLQKCYQVHFSRFINPKGTCHQ